MNLAGTVNIAFISIALGPIAKKNKQNAQQNKLDQNNGAEKALGSPV
jgi:hypothetical protein